VLTTSVGVASVLRRHGAESAAHPAAIGIRTTDFVREATASPLRLTVAKPWTLTRMGRTVTFPD
jgi:hypothetical protein